jgi:hypothetical protein
MGGRKMRALKLLYKEKNVFIGEQSEVPVPVEVVLKYRLGPLEFPEEDVKTYKVKGKTIEGIAIGEVPADVEEFERKHLIEDYSSYNKKKYPGSHRWLSREFYSSPRGEKNLFLYKYGKHTYIMRQNVENFIIWKWLEEKGKVLPKICGRNKEYCFYYAGYSKTLEATILKFDKNIPQPLLSSFDTNYGYCEYEHSYRSTIKTEAFYIDPLPFPPYSVIGAVKLLPPEKVMNKKEKKLPEIFDEIYLLKTLLLVDEPVPVIKISEEQLREFANHLNENIFDPNSIAEFPEEVYSNLWTISNEYVLLCKPKWPF